LFTIFLLGIITLLTAGMRAWQRERKSKSKTPSAWQPGVNYPTIMLEVEQVEQFRQEEKLSVKEACRKAGISVANYYARKRKLGKRQNGEWREEEAPQPAQEAEPEKSHRVPPGIMVSGMLAVQYVAIRMAIALIDLGEIKDARKHLVESITP
jgi:hypothetical protein